MVSKTFSSNVYLKSGDNSSSSNINQLRTKKEKEKVKLFAATNTHKLGVTNEILNCECNR